MLAAPPATNIPGIGALSSTANPEYELSQSEASVVRCANGQSFNGYTVWFAIPSGPVDPGLDEVPLLGLALSCSSSTGTAGNQLLADGVPLPVNHVFGSSHDDPEYTLDYTGLNGCPPDSALGALSGRALSVPPAATPMVWGLNFWCIPANAGNPEDPYASRPAHLPGHLKWKRTPYVLPKLEAKHTCDAAQGGAAIAALQVLDSDAGILGVAVDSCEPLQLPAPAPVPPAVLEGRVVTLPSPLYGPAGPAVPDSPPPDGVNLLVVRYLLFPRSDWEPFNALHVAHAVVDAVRTLPRVFGLNSAIRLGDWRVEGGLEGPLSVIVSAQLGMSDPYSLVALMAEENVAEKDLSFPTLLGGFLESRGFPLSQVRAENRSMLPNGASSPSRAPVPPPGIGRLRASENKDYEEVASRAQIVSCSEGGLFNGLKVWFRPVHDGGGVVRTNVQGLVFTCTTGSELMVDGKVVSPAFMFGSRHDEADFIMDYTGLNGCAPDAALGAIDGKAYSASKDAELSVWGINVWCLPDPKRPPRLEVLLPAHVKWQEPFKPEVVEDHFRCPVTAGGTGIGSFRVLASEDAVDGLEASSCVPITLGDPPPVPVTALEGQVAEIISLWGPAGPPEPDAIGPAPAGDNVAVRFYLRHLNTWDEENAPYIAHALKASFAGQLHTLRVQQSVYLQDWAMATPPTSRRLLEEHGGTFAFTVTSAVRDDPAFTTGLLLSPSFLSFLEMTLDRQMVNVVNVTAADQMVAEVEAAPEPGGGRDTGLVVGLSVAAGLALLALLLVCIVCVVRSGSRKRAERAKAAAESFTRITRKHITPAPSHIMGKEVSQFRLSSAVAVLSTTSKWSGEFLHTIESHSTGDPPSCDTTQRNARTRMHSDNHPTMQKAKARTKGNDQSYIKSVDASEAGSDARATSHDSEGADPSTVSDDPDMVALEQWCSDLRASGQPLAGKYVLQAEQHRGAHTLVCQACNRMNGDLLAVKFYLSNRAFLHEQQLYAKRLAGEHVPTMHDVLPGTSAQTSGMHSPSDFNSHAPCIVLEWGSRSLGQMLSPGRGRLLQDALELKIVLNRLVLALHALHRSDVVHMDVTPANVMWFSSEASMFTWKVVDFTKWAKKGQRTPVDTDMRYAAPEVVRAARAGEEQVSAQPTMDMWSFGVLCFEVFAHRRLFDPDTSRADMEGMLCGDIPLPFEHDPALLDAIEDDSCRCIVQGLLRRTPSARWTAARVLSSIPFLTGTVEGTTGSGGPAAPTPSATSRPLSVSASTEDNTMTFSMAPPPNGERPLKLQRMTLRQVDQNPAAAVLLSVSLVGLPGGARRSDARASGGSAIGVETSVDSYLSGLSRDGRDASFVSAVADMPGTPRSRRGSVDVTRTGEEAPCWPPASLGLEEDPVFYVVEDAPYLIRFALQKDRLAGARMPGLQLLSVRVTPDGGDALRCEDERCLEQASFSHVATATWRPTQHSDASDLRPSASLVALQVVALYKQDGEVQPLMVQKTLFLRIFAKRAAIPEPSGTLAAPRVHADVPPWARTAAHGSSSLVFMP